MPVETHIASINGTAILKKKMVMLVLSHGSCTPEENKDSCLCNDAVSQSGYRAWNG
jgi:hypothetical protein